MKKALMIIGGVVVGFIVFIVAIFVIVSLTSKKLVCKSKEGNITLLYNKSEVTGYTANDITYELDEQQELSKDMGIDAYLDEFEEWFENNTTGTCTRKK